MVIFFIDFLYAHEFDDNGTTGFPLKPEYSWFTRLDLKGWEENPRLVVSVRRFCKSRGAKMFFV